MAASQVRLASSVHLPRRRLRILALVMAAAAVVFLGVPAGGLLAPQAARADGTNLLSNPGCESGTTGYSGYQATLAASTSIKRSGAESCHVTSTGGTFYSIIPTYSYANPQVGRTFTASAWVRADANNGRTAYIAMRERGGPTADRGLYGTGVTLTTTWQLITGTITVQASGRTVLDFYVVQDPGATGNSFYVDDMTFQLTPVYPSGQAMPVGNLTGWNQIFAEDFTVDAATGSWEASCATDPDASQKIVYTGAGGTQWRTYPDCYTDTAGRPYRSDQVLSVHDGTLDFYLHDVDSQPAGANPSPVINKATESQYQTYGRYSVRFKVSSASLSNYYVAYLLWPQSNSDWQCAESDFPEAHLTSTTVGGHAHYGCSGSQDNFSAAIDFTQWHTYTQEWSPGVRKYYLDGTLIGTSTHSVFSQPERYQLQTETVGTTPGQSGHILVDWVVAYSYAP